MSKKKSWFETLCTMDEPVAPSKKKKTNKASTSRTRRKNYSAGPGGADDLPPFDDDAVEVVNNDKALEEVGQKAASRSVAPAAQKKPTAARRSSSGASGKAGATKQTGKPLPAEIVRRVMPYVWLCLGVVLGIMLLLSALLSGFTYDWTSDTHPFRVVGYYVEYFLFGMIGYGTFALPACMVYLSVARIREDGERAVGRGAASACLLVLISGMIHTCMIGADSIAQAWSPSTLYQLGADMLGGGMLGGWLGTLCYVGLGVIGTLVVGTLLIAVLLMLMLHITPKMVVAFVRARWQAYAEKREAREKEAKAEKSAPSAKERAAQKAAAEAPTHGKQLSLGEEETEEDDLPTMTPVRKKKAPEVTEPVDDKEYLDPMRALLGKEDARSRRKPNNEPYGGNPTTVFEDESASAPIEQVHELTVDEVSAREQSYAASSVAKVVPPQEEQEGELQNMVAYPDRVELDMDAEQDVVTPLEAPMDAEGEVLVEDETLAEDKGVAEVFEGDELDCRDGFDYSMESAENDDVVEGAEVIGGVQIKVERLSDEERERGERIAENVEESLPVRKPYVYPTLDLLNEPKPHSATKDQEIRIKMQKLRETLTNFRVRVEGISYACGPSVTRYEVRPAPGVRVRSIAGLADDIAMSLAAKSIRIEAPIPGKEAVGIEVPNTTRETVYLRRLIDSDEFRTRPSKLTACLGEDVAGEPILFDIVKMPHLLVAGTTGSGKSVCINDFIMSLVYKSSPDEVKIILIDPKQVEFTVYKDLPHLMAPIVCDPKRAAAALNLAVLEMEKRFQMIREVGVRDIAGYNAITENDRYEHPYMPQIVIVIDELADLMMQAKDEVETAIVRLAQKARAAGMHLVIGTQRPSVDVITGLIKANVPSRIACTVVSQVDSRTILDIAGAEKLLGMGDMLYAPVGSPKPLRVQGAFVSDGEVERVVDFIKRNNDPVRYDQEFLDNLDREAQMIGQKRTPDMDDDMDDAGADGHDPKFYEALRIAVDNNRISTSLLQRMLSIGYGRAAKIIDDMERMGFVSPAVGNKPREIRITKEAYAELIMNKDE